MLDGVGRPASWLRLDGGLANDNLVVALERGPRVVLRRFVREPGAARREALLLQRLAGRVPVPEVLGGGEDWLVLSWCEGRRLAEVVGGLSEEEAEALGLQVGAAMAAIHEEVLGEEGHLRVVGDRLVVRRWEEGTWAGYLDGLLAGVPGARLGPERSTRLRAVEPPVAPAAVLCHADFKPTNLLVEGGRLTAVLDWEFAFSGDPAFDLGQVLRWEDHAPPAFSAGIWRGCGLPGSAWTRALRWDLLNLVGFLDGPDAPVRHRDVLARIDRTLSRLG